MHGENILIKDTPGLTFDKDKEHHRRIFPYLLRQIVVYIFKDDLPRNLVASDQGLSIETLIQVRCVCRCNRHFLNTGVKNTHYSE